MSQPIQSAGLPEVLVMAYWDGERWIDVRVPETHETSRARRIFDHSWKALLEGALISLLVVGLIAGTAFAGRGGQSTGGGKGHNGGGTLTATVRVSPNPVPANSEFTISGCGYLPGKGVQFNLYLSGGTAVWGGMADGNGCLTNAVGWASDAGSARLDVLEGSTTKVASTTFSIQ
jgi:hypothetical protein